MFERLSPLVFLLTVFVTGCSVSSTTTPATQLATVSPPVALAFKADGEFGKSLTENERDSLGRAELQALNYGKAGQQVGWKNESGNQVGTIVAYQLFQVGDSSCRRFVHEISTMTGPQKADGTACLNSNGIWELVQ